MTTDLRDIAAVTALNEMMGKGWFSICTIDTVGKLLDRNPAGEAYDILHSLHCIHFDRMPQELRDAIPALVDATRARTASRRNAAAGTTARARCMTPG